MKRMDLGVIFNSPSLLQVYLTLCLGLFRPHQNKHPALEHGSVPLRVSPTTALWGALLFSLYQRGRNSEEFYFSQNSVRVVKSQTKLPVSGLHTYLPDFSKWRQMGHTQLNDGAHNPGTLNISTHFSTSKKVLIMWVNPMGLEASKAKTKANLLASRGKKWHWKVELITPLMLNYLNF
jgi:hypothetical protein